MSVGERHLENQPGTAIFSNEFQCVEQPGNQVFHEGGQVRIRITQPSDERVMVIPLRNGFPLYAADRAAQCFSVLDSQGRRTAAAIRLPEIGLHLMFDQPPVGGDYFIHTQTPVGRA